MYRTSATTHTTATRTSIIDRLSQAVNESRYAVGFGLFTILAALGAIAGLIATSDGRPAITGINPFDGVGQSAEATTSGTVPDPTAAQSGTTEVATGSDGSSDPDFPVGGGSNGQTNPSDPQSPSGSDSTDPAGPTNPDSPTEPSPTPDVPTNRPPTISDLTVEATGLTVVVRYRVDDPDGDEVSTNVAFGGTGTNIDLPNLPEQGPVAGGTGGGNGMDPSRPTAPRDQVVDGTLSPPGADPAGPSDHDAQPIADGSFEARHTFDREQVGLAHTSLITVAARDTAGAVSTETTTIELQAVDTITISDVSYRIPNPACFQSRRARRLFGNIDLQGAIDSRNALSEELRADRPAVTIAREQTVEAQAGLGLTVSFQPAMEGAELTSHVATHRESAKVDVEIGRGDCAGRLAYRVVVDQH